MSGLAAIILGAVVALALAPLLRRLAHRWRRGTAAFAAGSVAGSALPDGGVGGYISRLRGGAEFHGDSDAAESTAADSTAADGDSD